MLDHFIYAEPRVQVLADEIDRQRKDRVGDDGRLGRPALSDAFRLDENRGRGASGHLELKGLAVQLLPHRGREEGLETILHR